MFNKDFVRSLLSDQKKLLYMCQIRPVNVPKYDELSVKNIYPHLKADVEIMIYFPDQLPEGRWPDRTYMFTILNTLRPEYV